MMYQPNQYTDDRTGGAQSSLINLNGGVVRVSLNNKVEYNIGTKK